MARTMEVGGKEYTVIGYEKDTQGKSVPLLDFPMMSDYKWQLGCLNDRLENPQKYIDKGEDVEATIKRLRQWLAEHSKEAMNEFTKHRD